MSSSGPRRCTAEEIEQIDAAVAAGKVTRCPAMPVAKTTAMPADEAIDRVLERWIADAPRRRKQQWGHR
jgi:hypothetical protein